MIRTSMKSGNLFHNESEEMNVPQIKFEDVPEGLTEFWNEYIFKHFLLSVNTNKVFEVVVSKFDILNFLYESTPFDYLIEGGNASVDGIQADKIDILKFMTENFLQTLYSNSLQLLMNVIRNNIKNLCGILNL